ncbi:hypothetical protein T01_6878 [Trichinella spiralis]|uniref:Uncharacterized protein n=1 Tax=Trichinella spiralis TaxID=6334 RepID=A0A0V0YYC3_TRISP|nr:hypothetical protein T01_6878 [Trichinella spiralis]
MELFRVNCLSSKTRIDVEAIHLLFRSSRLWIQAVIETEMFCDRNEDPRHWSVTSPVDFMMKTTDFTMKKCVFYDP